jgi:hypothetical protein
MIEIHIILMLFIIIHQTVGGFKEVAKWVLAIN